MFCNKSTGYRYEGEWGKSLPHGFGKEVFPNEDYFEGEFMYGSKYGKGSYRFKNGN